MEKAIEIKNLTKEFKNVKALKGVNLDIFQGEFLTLLGENGAGKTTLIKIICGIIMPTIGSASVYGLDIVKDHQKISELINVSPQETAVSNNLSVKQNLELLCDLYGFNRDKKEKKVHELILKLKLDNVKDKKAKTLSGGYQRRLSIALALVTEPKILFLDEPTLGLDVRIRRELWQVIKELKGKTTIILTTHYLEEVEALADRVVVMEKGEILEVGSVNELKEKTKTDSLENAFMYLVGGEQYE